MCVNAGFPFGLWSLDNQTVPLASLGYYQGRFTNGKGARESVDVTALFCLSLRLHAIMHAAPHAILPTCLSYLCPAHAFRPHSCVPPPIYLAHIPTHPSFRVST